MKVTFIQAIKDDWKWRNIWTCFVSRKHWPCGGCTPPCGKCAWGPEAMTYGKEAR